MKLYIAGPMTGFPDFNYPAFFEAEEQLKAAGYKVENPARNELKDRPANEPMWLGYMRMSLVQISRVDGLAMLDGWRSSDGAKLEEHIGQGLKLHVRYLRAWLDQDMIDSLKLLCPECSQGKTVNCVGQAMHPNTDELVACGSLR